MCSEGWRDTPESPVTKSLHVLAALVLRNFLDHAADLVGPLEENVIAEVAMSSLDAGKPLTEVLAMWTDCTSHHLPPYR